VSERTRILYGFAVGLDAICVVVGLATSNRALATVGVVGFVVLMALTAAVRTFARRQN
jgi:hypothetical protein